MKKWKFSDYVRRHYLIKNPKVVTNFLEKNSKRVITKNIEMISFEKRLLNLPLSVDFWQVKELYNEKKLNQNYSKFTSFKEGIFLEKIDKLIKIRDSKGIMINYKCKSFTSNSKIINMISNIKIYYLKNKKHLIVDFGDDKILEISNPSTNINKNLKHYVKPILPIEAIAFNEYMRYISKKAIKNTFRNEFKDTEIELKFKNNDPLIHKKIYSFFKSRKGDFIIENNFPYFLYRNLVVGYLSKNEKIVLGYRQPPLKIKKEKIEKTYIENYLIIRRKERKRVSTYSAFDSINPNRIIIKRKRVFWIENKKTNRIYHIAIDKEMSSKGSLSQVEIEYAGIISKKETNDLVAIKKDLVAIAKILSIKFNSLKPTTKTKAEWLIKRT